MKKLLFLLVVLPLSACFDADLGFVVHDDETATMSAHMLLGPEMYGMIAQSGQNPCEEGVGTANADGTFSCRVNETDTIDNLIADIETGKQNAASGGVNHNQGVTVERLDGPYVKLIFDLAEVKQAAAESGADPSMIGMLQQAFQGHRIHMTITGKNIVETNGALSADGKTAEITIPLRALIEPDASLPDQFVTIVQTE